MSGILMILAIWVVILVVVCTALSAGWAWLKRWRRGPDTTFGSAQWMTKRQLKATGLLDHHAGIVLGRWRGHTLRDAGEGHCLLCGPSRGAGIKQLAGKGTTVVLPTLYEWPFDCVVIDPKGENADLTMAWREAHGALVYSFDPMGESSQTSIDLLSSIRLDTPYALSDADCLAAGFVPDPGPSKPGPHYYASQGAKILSTVLLYVAECGPEKSLGGAYRFMSSAEPPAKRLGRMLTSTHPGVLSHTQQLLQMKPDVLNPLWTAATDGLSLWRDPRLDARTSSNDVDLGAFQTGDTSLTLYLRSAESQLERLAPLMRTICQVIINRCMERPIDRSRRQLLFMLDEFSSMGPCGPIVQSLPRMAGYGLRCALIVQDLSDIVRLYGRDNSIVQNCSTRAFMTPNDPFTALYIARLLGTTTVETISERTGSSLGLQGASSQAGESIGPAARGLLTVDEILRFSEHDVLVFLSAQDPLRASKIPWFDPYYHRRTTA